jgi:hypothetical protein
MTHALARRLLWGYPDWLFRVFALCYAAAAAATLAVFLA